MKRFISPILSVLILAAFSSKVFSESIFVNQLGFLPSSEKYALIENPKNPSMKAVIIDVNSGKPVVKVDLMPPIIDKFSNTPVSKIDFTYIQKPGRYKVVYDGISSYDFKIDPFVYQNALNLTTSSYYYQDCDSNVMFQGMLLHPPCHMNDALIFRTDSKNTANTKLDATGGWHDAGDYGKYIATGSITTALLLDAYETYPNFAKMNLVSNDNKTYMPDVLNEVKKELDWMLKMQRKDGAVYRKCGGKNWPSNTLLPQNDTQDRFVYGISTQDTARFAAAMSKASRVYKLYDKSFSDKCLKASLKAWQFIETKSNYTDYDKSDDMGSGGYPDPNYDKDKYAYTDVDDKTWAASELYLSTKDIKFISYIKSTINSIEYEPFSWKNTYFMAISELAKSNIKDSEVQSKIKSLLITIADNICKKMYDNPYNISMDEFKWGSNAILLADGVTLINAYNLTHNEMYKNNALKILNYIFGTNPMNKSYVTGLGSNSPKFPHHRYNMALNVLIPGFLVGGPNNTATDKVAPTGLKIKNYVDDQNSYATNEYAIDYNAQLVYVLAWVNSLTNNTQSTQSSSTIFRKDNDF